MTSQSSALQAGSHIGDLQINEVLGVGSFGITYLVTDPAIGTRFALKEYFPAKQLTRLEDGKVILKDGQSATVFSNGLKLFESTDKNSGEPLTDCSPIVRRTVSSSDIDISTV